MNNQYREELLDLGFLGILQEGILGSTSEERRIQIPKNYKNELKKIKKLRNQYNLNLCSKFSYNKKNDELKIFQKKNDLLNPLNKETFQNSLLSCKFKQPKILNQIVDRLSLLASKYPNISGIFFEIQGFHRLEGKELSHKLISLLVFLNYSIRGEENNFLRFLIAEKVIKMTQRYQGTSNSGWDNVRLLLNFFSREEITDEYLLLKYENKSALWDLYIKGAKMASILVFSFFNGTSRIISKIRKKGYNDKGSRTPDHKKGREGVDRIYLKEKFGDELIEYEEGGNLILKDYNETKSSIEETLLEIWKNSNKAFLEFQEQEALKRSTEKQETKGPPETIRQDFNPKEE